MHGATTAPLGVSCAWGSGEFLPPNHKHQLQRPLQLLAFLLPSFKEGTFPPFEEGTLPPFEEGTLPCCSCRLVGEDPVPVGGRGEKQHSLLQQLLLSLASRGRAGGSCGVRGKKQHLLMQQLLLLFSSGMVAVRQTRLGGLLLCR